MRLILRENYKNYGVKSNAREDAALIVKTMVSATLTPYPEVTIAEHFKSDGTRRES
jgi:hypothetical protein